MSAPDLDPTERHAKMIAAATWLAKQRFARVGWGDQRDGKGPARAWKSDATDDPALVPALLRGARNALVIPTGRALIIDIDERSAWGELAAAGLPETFTIDSPTTDHGHVYGWVPEGIDMATIPGTFTGGEIRRHSPTTGTASMVLGPWAKRSDGVYAPRPGPRVIATLPESVIDHLIASARRQDATRGAARGPADDGWKIATGRHDWLVSKARWLRGNGLSGENLLAELLRLDRDRCDPPLAEVPGRGLDEIQRIAGWTDQRIADDPPDIILTSSGGGQATPVDGIDGADLIAMDLPPLREIVPGLLPEGTTALASPPKVGKSCLVYQMAVEIALGGSLLGRQAIAGSVLYLALEDGKRRGKERLLAALDGRRLPRGRLEVRWSSRRIGEGLEEDVSAWLDAHPDAALVAIDTLGRVRPRTTGKRNQYEVDVEDLGRLQGLFRDRPVALLIVHHSRKDVGGDDFLASVSGTYGITGSVDTIVVIRRKRLEAFGTIVVTGRELAEAEVPVRFDGMTWHEAPSALAEVSFERMEVYRVVEEHGPIFPAAIAERLATSRTSVQNMVAKLVTDGAVARTSNGYTLAHARVDHVPDDSDDSDGVGSHRSHEGHTREGDDLAAIARDIFGDLIADVREVAV